MLWYNPSVKPTSPYDAPTLMHFEDMGFVSARSGWEGGESFVFFICGPYIGKKAIREMTYCASSAHHVHPDRNSFILHGAGEWLIREDGVCGKYTMHHNTLMIDGREQLGGGTSIFDGSLLHARCAMPEILCAESAPDIDHIAGDAAPAYPPDMGLKRFVRHLVFLKPDVLVVVDDIALDRPRDLELRFHPEQREAVRDGNAFVTRGKKAALRIEPLTTEGVEASLETHPLIARDYTESLIAAVRLGVRKSEWKNATAFSWCSASGEPVRVVMKKDGDIWRFGAGGRSVAFNWNTGKVHTEKY
jgi:hypothetical protein